ncbi:hypothetical protein [Salinisphaera sp. G21_0]|uniref:hypothetical protein n=1 Tax=Salinisphaera sp. G21_0 TaxID=2821094 RepID=UPI001ADB7D45|nr:hypothetical protein [Salinisphaera sp. G21_0]MBO9483803.1 hypothetical protein [Salinisphaera sp. G21_0]
MGYPALPGSVDRYVRQMLDTMAGRTGSVGDQVVTIKDLAQIGLVNANPNILNSQNSANKQITDAVTRPPTNDAGNVILPETEPADPPTTPEGLNTTGTFGAVILSWTAPNYAGHAYTEVHRAQIDDPTQSQLVHQEPTSSYADVTGNTTTHYYWLKHINKDGAKSQFNQVAGVAGAGTATISVDDLVLEHPEILQQPFTVIDNGSGVNPRYVMALNGDIAINGAVNISQLVSGELANGTALTVGQNSIELSTASDGTGQLIIAGQGGIQNNDYMIMNAGRIQAYVFVPGVGHVPYKEVKRVETGTANSGQQVKIPAYFRSQPTIHLYPRDMSVYNADYPNQSQKIEMYYSAPQPHPTEDGAWLFTPFAKLVLAAGSETASPGWTYAGSSNSQTWTSTNISNLKGVTVYCRAASFRRTSGTTYNNRKVTVYLDYKLSSSSSWSVGGSEVVNIDKFTTHSMSLGKALSQNKYDIRVRFVAADRSGTFSDGNPTYDYTQANKTGSSWSKTNEPTGSARTQTQFITINNHALSGWEITRIDYRATVDITLKVRNLFTRNSSSGSMFRGKARVRIPNSSGGHSTYEATTKSSYVDFGNPWETYSHNNKSISWSDTSYKDGKIYPAVELYGNKAGYTQSSSSGSYIPSSHAYVSVKSVSATVYYRKQQSNPQTYNNYYMDSARYDKSATDISLDNAVVTWMATSDN